MRSSLDCIPCFVRQALDAARAISNDPAVHEDIVREMLLRMGEADLSQSPPSFAQDIHRRLRAVTANDDPYRKAKDRHNQMALRLLPELRAMVHRAPHPLGVAVRLAIAGNVIDMGTAANVTESSLRQAIQQALGEPLAGDQGQFCRAVEAAESILYLADNAGRSSSTSCLSSS
jgi:damage-control phosphatase, subfamily I